VAELGAAGSVFFEFHGHLQNKVRGSVDVRSLCRSTKQELPP
jgi:hypothetical protein